jgi:hypothetical protein
VSAKPRHPHRLVQFDAFRRMPQGASVWAASDSEDSDSSLTFTATNSYTAKTGPVGDAYPWLSGRWLVEPYRDTTFSVDNSEWTLPDVGQRCAAALEHSSV